MNIDSVLIKGDGIGPEIIDSTLEVLSAFTHLNFNWDERVAGLKSLNKNGLLVPEETLNAIKDKTICLKGPFTTPIGGGHRSANWTIRRELDLYACVRPIKDIQKNIDFIIIRENTEDLYSAIEWMATKDVGQALKIASKNGCTRIARFAYEYCGNRGRDKVTIVHKANNLKVTEGMFLNIAKEQSNIYKHIKTNDMLVDTASANIILKPQDFDILLTSCTFGDILSSIGAALLGSMGVAPSASYSDDISLYEAAHGSAPDIEGKQKANPISMILASGMMLKDLGLISESKFIEEAVNEVLEEGILPNDLGGDFSTLEMTYEIKKRVSNKNKILLKERRYT